MTDINGDNDGYVEVGEVAQLIYTIEGANGSFDHVDVSADGCLVRTEYASEFIPLSPTTYLGVANNTACATEGYHNFTIEAYDALDQLVASQPVHYYVTRDYHTWVTVYNDTTGAAKFRGGVANIVGTVPGGNWIYLQGGNQIRVPDLNLGLNITNLVAIIANAQGYTDNYTASFGYTGVISGSIPSSFIYNTGCYPVYTAGDIVNSNLDASTSYACMQLQVGLINTSPLATIDNSTKTLPPGTFTHLGTVTTDAAGDACLPSVGPLAPGVYALVVYDNSIVDPNGIGLVSAVPILVTRSTETVDVYNINPCKTVINPGDSIGIDETLLNVSSKTYVYTAFAIPEQDYHGNVCVYSTNNSLKGVNISIDAFSINFSGNVYQTVAYAVKNPNQTLHALQNKWDNRHFMGTFHVKNDTVSTLSLDINQSAPTGKYILLTAVFDPSTGEVVAVNQTTFWVTTNFTISLANGWNIISEPLIMDNCMLNIETFFAPAMNNITIIWKYDAVNGMWLNYVPGAQGNTLSTIDEKSGYLVMTNGTACFTINGADPGSETIHLYSSHGGWNIIGYPSLNSSTPCAQFGGIADKINIIWGYDRVNQTWMSYVANASGNNLLTINPGEGYLVMMNADADYTVGQ